MGEVERSVLVTAPIDDEEEALYEDSVAVLEIGVPEAVRVEYGLRYSTGKIANFGGDRNAAENQIINCRENLKLKVGLVQRTVSEWEEV